MTIGPMIKKIRLDKNISQAFMAEGIMNRSHYSKFERGETTTNAENFLKLIQKLNVSFEELMLQDTNVTFILRKNLSNEMARAFTYGDNDILQKIEKEATVIFKESGELFFNHLQKIAHIYQILIENNYDTHLVTDECQSIKEYLFNVETWGIYEYTLLNNVISTFKLEDIIFFAEKTIVQMEKFTVTDKTYIANAIIYNTALLLFKGSQYKKSMYFSQKSYAMASQYRNVFEIIVSKILLMTNTYFITNKEFDIKKLQRLFISLAEIENQPFYDALREICVKEIPILDELIPLVHI